MSIIENWEWYSQFSMIICNFQDVVTANRIGVNLRQSSVGWTKAQPTLLSQTPIKPSLDRL